MSEFIEIPQWDGKKETKPAWVLTTDPNGYIVRPHIICQCGRNTNIGNHHIHPDGTITASYHHHQIAGDGETVIGCGWHVFLKMKDWIGKEFLPKSDLPKD